MAMLFILALQGVLIFALFWFQRRSRGVASKKTKPPQHHD